MFEVIAIGQPKGLSSFIYVLDRRYMKLNCHSVSSSFSQLENDYPNLPKVSNKDEAELVVANNAEMYDIRRNI
jgi:hypothetical protein